MQQIGYSVVNINNGNEIISWGNTLGQVPGIPNPIVAPNGDIIYGAKVGDLFYNKYKLVERWYDDTPGPDGHSRIDFTINFNGTIVIVTPIYSTVVDTPVFIDYATFRSRWTDAEKALLYNLEKSSWAIRDLINLATAQNGVLLTGPDASAAKALFVNNNVLTQVRADEIFLI